MAKRPVRVFFLCLPVGDASPEVMAFRPHQGIIFLTMVIMPPARRQYSTGFRPHQGIIFLTMVIMPPARRQYSTGFRPHQGIIFFNMLDLPINQSLGFA